MASFNALISSVTVVKSSVVTSMDFSRSDSVFSKAFFSSSAVSKSFAQVAFLVSSSTCSFFSRATISSIMVKTFSKPTFLPLKASMRKFNWLLCAGSARNTERAWLETSFEVTCTCTKLLAGLGSVFLKSSSASSSLRILMVSASASFSSARFFSIASHSLSLVAQFSSMSAKNFWSSAKASSVSSKSLVFSAISTPNLPTRAVFSSIAFVCAANSFSFAAFSSAWFFWAASSASVISAKSFSISSFITFKMPTICPLAYPLLEPWSRKDMSMSRSALAKFAEFTARRRTACAEPVCKKEPMPVEIASMALVNASMLAVSSADSFVNSAASFSRIDSELAMASAASFRPYL
mmetsp:Transcript_14825/g.33355  ORF Transcript_14825/g.33355 Transcript_14825/m.33355 type:complete len:351 (-) Transcript_14825:375-1427(-)